MYYRHIRFQFYIFLILILNLENKDGYLAVRWSNLSFYNWFLTKRATEPIRSKRSMVPVSGGYFPFQGKAPQYPSNAFYLA